jgi:ABC-type transporter Mla MlaB component
MDASAQRTLAFAIRGPIARADLPGLCDRVCMLLSEHEPAFVECDVRSVEPDAVAVDALARLELAARGYGCHVALRGASRGLLDLVALMGLENVLRE